MLKVIVIIIIGITKTLIIIVVINQFTLINCSVYISLKLVCSLYYLFIISKFIFVTFCIYISTIHVSIFIATARPINRPCRSHIHHLFSNISILTCNPLIILLRSCIAFTIGPMSSICPSVNSSSHPITFDSGITSVDNLLYILSYKSVMIPTSFHTSIFFFYYSIYNFINILILIYYFTFFICNISNSIIPFIIYRL